jgi:hypothetical protein
MRGILESDLQTTVYRTKVIIIKMLHLNFTLSIMINMFHLCIHYYQFIHYCVFITIYTEPSLFSLLSIHYCLSIRDYLSMHFYIYETDLSNEWVWNNNWVLIYSNQAPDCTCVLGSL